MRAIKNACLSWIENILRSKSIHQHFMPVLIVYFFLQQLLLEAAERGDLEQVQSIVTRKGNKIVGYVDEVSATCSVTLKCFLKVVL